MHLSIVVNMIAGVLQFAVACYALWLARRFGAACAGWLLFCAFASLAMLHIVLSCESFSAALNRDDLANIAYAVTSVLMLVAMVHLGTLLKKYSKAEAAARLAQAGEQRIRAELEDRVRKETEKLNRTNEELRQTAKRLEAEIAERERQTDREEKTHKEMLAVSRQAGMSEVATAVLHNVGNVLNSVNISASLVADHVADFKVENISRVASLMREQGAELGNYIMNDPKGRQLPDYLSKLASHLSAEQSLILKEIGFVRTRIGHIKEIVATQQNYGKVMGLTEKIRMDELVEDVLRIQEVELSEKKVQIQRQYEQSLPEVVVDKHKVLQILLNLFSNAKHACIESSQPEKRVKIRVTNGDDKVRVAVSDNGVGIPAANLTAIFNHGFTTRKKEGGHGFGLHGSALAAKDIGGALAVQSEGPGRGATFTLEIPLKRNITPYS